MPHRSAASWELFSLNDIGEVARGKSRYRPRYAEHLYGGPYPFIQTGDVKASQGRIRRFDQTYSEEGLAQSRLWPAGTMCITIAANIAETGILEFPACFPDSIVGFVADAAKVDVRFVEYSFRNLKRTIQHQASGSVQDNINLETLARLRIPIPRLAEQVAIANVLGALDDKIAANERLILIAEKLMLSLLQSVNCWDRLSSLAQQSTASVKSEDFDDVVAHFSLPAFDDGANPEIVSGHTIKSNKFLLSEPCVLFSKLNPRIPRIWSVSTLPVEMALASTEFVVLAPVGVDPAVLWASLSQPEISEELRQMVAGTSGSHQRIRPHDLLGVRVRDVRALDSKSAAIIRQLGLICDERRRESGVLARTRDEVLPLLMSGKLTVKGAESVVEEVI